MIKVQNVHVPKRLYTDFMKKLKGFQVTETALNNVLIIEYHNDSSSGVLRLKGC